MARHFQHPMAAFWSAHPLAVWTRLAVQSADMLMASGEVVAHRSQRMAAMGKQPSASDRREMDRMVSEKVSAATESVQAMSSTSARVCQNAMLGWMDLFTRQTAAFYGFGRAPRWNAGTLANRSLEAAAQIAGAGLAPISRRAKSNARRLRKRG